MWWRHKYAAEAYSMNCSDITGHTPDLLIGSIPGSGGRGSAELASETLMISETVFKLCCYLKYDCRKYDWFIVCELVIDLGCTGLCFTVRLMELKTCKVYTKCGGSKLGRGRGLWRGHLGRVGGRSGGRWVQMTAGPRLGIICTGVATRSMTRST